MAGSNIISLFRPRIRTRDWDNQDLAEFYRVEATLNAVGFRVETDRGLTDEGEPWFIFMDAVSGDVMVHCARTDGAYLIASAAFDQVLRGPDFRTLVETFLERHPLMLPPADVSEKKGVVRLHPTALLVALVTTAFFKLSATDAEAAPLDGDDTVALGPLFREEHAARIGHELDRRQSLVVLAAIAVVTDQLRGDTGSAIGELQYTLPDNAGALDASDRERPAVLPASLERASVADRDGITEVIASGFAGTPTGGQTGASGSIETGVQMAIDSLSEMMELFPALPIDAISGLGETSERKGSSDTASVFPGAGLGPVYDGHDGWQALFSSESWGEMGTTGLLLDLAAQAQMASASISVTSPANVTSTAKVVTDAPADLTQDEPSYSLVLNKGNDVDTTGSSGSSASTATEEAGDEIAVDVGEILDTVAPHLKINSQRVKYSDQAQPFDDAAMDFIKAYVIKEGSTATFSDGSNVVIYDTSLNAAAWNVQLLTWVMDDGSTISLLGKMDHDFPMML